MECIEERIDLREMSEEDRALMRRQTELMFEVNHARPGAAAYADALGELMGSMGEGSFVNPPVQGTRFDLVRIGAHVAVMGNLLAMARGGITIGDRAQIAANVQLLTNNHDPYDPSVLLCRPIEICEGAWIGAGATILPGVRVGRHAVVGAAAVVTRDVGDYEVVVGNPARVVRTLDPARFDPPAPAR